MYIYQKVNGELYISKKYISFEDRQCDGSFDSLIGEFNNKKDAWKLLKYKCKIGVLDKNYAKRFIEDNINE